MLPTPSSPYGNVPQSSNLLDASIAAPLPLLSSSVQSLSNPADNLTFSRASNFASSGSNLVSQLASVSLSINNVSQNEGNNGITPYIFTVSLSAPTNQTVTVAYSTVDGTATVTDTDYVSTAGVLTFTPGETVKTIAVTVNGDRKFEPNETFQINLANPTNATLATTSGVGTIVNDDPIPTLSINNIAQPEGNFGTTAFTFLVTLSNPSSQTVSVQYRTADETATLADDDYLAATGALVFNPGEIVKTITVNGIRDRIVEPNETFRVNLTNPSNATLLTASGIGTLLNDDAFSNSDFNGDEISDVLLRNAAIGQNMIWTINQASLSAITALPTVLDSAWKIEGTADFNGDRNPDILWRNQKTGQNAIWVMNGTSLRSAIFLATVADSSWKIIGTDDFNGDGTPDILWRNSTSGQNVIWQINQLSLQTAIFLPTLADQNWVIQGTADFNYDGTSDIFWRNQASGQNAVWLINNLSLGKVLFPEAVSGSNWIANFGDFNGDGKVDLFWRNTESGQNVIWEMDGVSRVSVVSLPNVAPSSWVISQIGNFDQDGKLDILWRDYESGRNVIWKMNGSSFSTATFLPDLADINWRVAKN